MKGDWIRLPSGIWVKPWQVPEGQELTPEIVLGDFVARVIAPLNALHKHCQDDRCLVAEQHAKADQN